ncbi:hypothetical protein Lalb_Chr12g0209411 [Lupinus albus]|uniref:Uncharacterized protein n=1 Tax=Lupinus albus TaxID=3870 RepID=A0A6A4PP80_LUPAL|nr:hypothetical protein Lalb_Chr12g0209411 [Lupinus albus]
MQSTVEIIICKSNECKASSYRCELIFSSHIRNGHSFLFPSFERAQTLLIRISITQNNIYWLSYNKSLLIVTALKSKQAWVVG